MEKKRRVLWEVACIEESDIGGEWRTVMLGAISIRLATEVRCYPHGKLSTRRNRAIAFRRSQARRAACRFHCILLLHVYLIENMLTERVNLISGHFLTHGFKDGGMRNHDGRSLIVHHLLRLLVQGNTLLVIL